jgi:nickel transport protein
MMGKFVLMLFLMLAACDVSDGHRMMMGYKVNELQVTTLYDDGTPAQGVEIEALCDAKPIANGLTDEKGAFTFKPGENIGELTFVGSSAGHRAELSLNLAQRRQADETSLPMRALAGLGYLLGIAGLAMIYISWKDRKRA